VGRMHQMFACVTRASGARGVGVGLAVRHGCRSPVASVASVVAAAVAESVLIALRGGKCPRPPVIHMRPLKAVRSCGRSCGRRVGRNIVAEGFAGFSLLERRAQHSASQPVQRLFAGWTVKEGGEHCG
jgi:hypothetical protein